MKVQPFNCNGIEIMPENDWELAFLYLLSEKIDSENFYSSETVPNQEFTSFIIE